jgi:sn-glycerol 3-phosphate transport system permease protein
MKKFLLFLSITLLVVMWLGPLIVAALMSIRPMDSPITQGNVFFADQVTLDNFREAWVTIPWLRHYWNSAVIVVGILSVQVTTITLAGYAFARMRFPASLFLLVVVLLQLMIPTDVLLVQNFSTIRILGLFDTRIAVMVPYWGSALGLLLLHQTFREVPLDYEDASRLDGVGYLQRIWHVYMPLSQSGYLAFALVSISFHWNSFLWPMIVTRSIEARPVTVGLNLLLNMMDVGARYGPLMAGALIVIGPLVFVFMLFQRQFLESFAKSGLK